MPVHMRGPKPVPIADRLWPRVDTSGECWLWQGPKNPNGYGLIGTGRKGRIMLVHRLVWMLMYGDPSGLCVLHHCDVRACCRPEHLFLGTQLDNVRDMTAKGRRSPHAHAPRKNPRASLL